MSQTIQNNAEQVLLGKKTNVLLIKDTVGKAKPTTRDLPHGSFSFGKHDLLPDRDTVDQGKFSICQLSITPITYSCVKMEIPLELIHHKSRP